MKVAFVCTGNVFRSMAAEYCLKAFIKHNNYSNIEVLSLGLEGGKYKVLPETINAMADIGIDVTKHKPRLINASILNSCSVIVSMALNHKEALEKIGVKSVLFNELYKNESSSIPDVPDLIPDWNTNRIKMSKLIKSTIEYINSATPMIYNRLNNKFFK